MPVDSGSWRQTWVSGLALKKMRELTYDGSKRVHFFACHRVLSSVPSTVSATIRGVAPAGARRLQRPQLARSVDTRSVWQVEGRVCGGQGGTVAFTLV